MAERGEFRFEIADKTPLSLSMERLAAYWVATWEWTQSRSFPF